MFSRGPIKPSFARGRRSPGLFRIEAAEIIILGSRNQSVFSRRSAPPHLCGRLRRTRFRCRSSFRLAFAEGQPEHALWRELDRRADDLLVSKNRLTPFADPARELETRLRARGIEMALIVGTVTNVCCECTARDAAMRNFKTIMISDANASRNDAEHNATLSIFLQAFGGVLSTNEAIALIDGASVE